MRPKTDETDSRYILPEDDTDEEDSASLSKVSQMCPNSSAASFSRKFAPDIAPDVQGETKLSERMSNKEFKLGVQIFK